MIKIFLGQLGSGKSASMVRELMNDKSGRVTYTNLITKNIKNVIHIKPEMVIMKTKVSKSKNVDKMVFELNKDFWAKQKKPLNVVWDEIHLTANARSSMSKVNMILSRFIAMARRITGFDKRGYGHLIFIAQTERTIDVNIRDLASEIRYHIGHWVIQCEDCGIKLVTNSERQQVEICLQCGSFNILKSDFKVEVRKFNSWDNYFNYRLNIKGNWNFERYIIPDIEKYFGYYDTMQMTDMWENYINE